MRILLIILNLLFIVGICYAVHHAFGWLGVVAYAAYVILHFAIAFENAKHEIEEQQRAAGTWWSEL